MRRIGWIEQVGIQHRIVLHSGQRNTLLAEMVERRLEIVNRLRHIGVFEHALDSISERLVFQRDHRPCTRRIRNCNTLFDSGTLTLGIHRLQSQKPGLFRLRLLVFCCALGVDALSVLGGNRQRERRVLAQASQVLFEFSTQTLSLTSCNMSLSLDTTKTEYDSAAAFRASVPITSSAS